MPELQKVTTNLWFDDQAEAAAAFYTSIFQNSSIGRTTRFGEEGFEIHGKPAGSVMTVEFQIAGRDFVALNGGPMFQFTEAISFIVNCDSQEELDYYWEKLSQGGDPQAQQCGWLKDRFGVSWQIVPTVLAAMVSDPDTEKSQRVMRALFPMKKIDIAALERAYQGQ